MEDSEEPPPEFDENAMRQVQAGLLEQTGGLEEAGRPVQER
jgi:hypothetical protein